MSRKKAKMLFWAALVVLAYIPYLMQTTPSCRLLASGCRDKQLPPCLSQSIADCAAWGLPTVPRPSFRYNFP